MANKKNRQSNINEAKTSLTNNVNGLQAEVASRHGKLQGVWRGINKLKAGVKARLRIPKFARTIARIAGLDKASIKDLGNYTCECVQPSVIGV